MNRARSFVASYGVDALIGVLAVVGATAIATRNDAQQPDGAALALEAAAVAAMILLLLLRRWAPFLVPAATWLASAALAFVDGALIVGQAPVSIAGMIAAVLLGNLRDERQARAGLAVVVICAAAVVYNDPTHSVANLFFIPVLFAVGWLVGFALHERTEQTELAEQRAARAEREREDAGRIAVAEERARIARELHDVVAHAVSVMVLQVGALRHRMPQEQAEDREALRNVEAAGRTALAEMRGLLDAMRREEDGLDLAPQPGLASLEGLLGDLRATGLSVRFEQHGAPVELPPGLDLSAYRIVQEALTNVIKHAQAQHAQVHVRFGEGHLQLEVRDDGVGSAPSDGLGHGLVGMRERVRLYGGDMTAGAAEAGGFVVRARLPLSTR